MMTTSYYTLFYTATLIVHVIFMNYVLGGTAYLAYRSLRRRVDGDPIVETARDWMPFTLSAAITAGIAPLLFLQILRQHAFYTANLLLFHRWMSIVPVLIVGFYLMYLLKSRPWHSKATPWLAVGSFLCIAWTGLSWTENHLLSLGSMTVWTSVYESKAMWFRDARVGLRFGVWLFGSLPTFAMLMAWQLKLAQKRTPSPMAGCTRVLGQVAMAGLSVAAPAAALYYLRSRGDSGPLAGWPIAAALVIAGGTAQWYVWRRFRIAGGFDHAGLWFLTACVLATLGGATWLRECIRNAASARESTGVSARAGSVGGFAVFAVFLVINGLLVAWCLRIATRPPHRA